MLIKQPPTGCWESNSASLHQTQSGSPRTPTSVAAQGLHAGVWCRSRLRRICRQQRRRWIPRTRRADRGDVLTFVDAEVNRTNAHHRSCRYLRTLEDGLVQRHKFRARPGRARWLSSRLAIARPGCGNALPYAVDGYQSRWDAHKRQTNLRALRIDDLPSIHHEVERRAERASSTVPPGMRKPRNETKRWFLLQTLKKELVKLSRHPMRMR